MDLLKQLTKDQLIQLLNVSVETASGYQSLFDFILAQARKHPDKPLKELMDELPINRFEELEKEARIYIAQCKRQQAIEDNNPDAFFEGLYDGLAETIVDVEKLNQLLMEG